MSYAPEPLLKLQSFMQQQTGLPLVELGVVGNPDHDGGYHCGWDRRHLDDKGVLHDYSWQESTRDSSHKTDAARAFDCGMFPRLREMSIWMVQQCQQGAPDTSDIREIIYSPDGVNVLRWDRLKIRGSGDSSHLTHTHFSFFADAESRDKTSLFQRFFEGGGVSRNTDWRLQEIIAGKETIVVPVNDSAGSPPLFTEPNMPQRQYNRMEVMLNEIKAKLDQLAQVPPGSVDIEAIRTVVRQEMDKTGFREI